MSPAVHPSIPEVLKSIFINYCSCILYAVLMCLILVLITVYVCWDQILKILLYRKYPEYLCVRIRRTSWNLMIHAGILLAFTGHIAVKYPQGWLEWTFFDQQQESVSSLERLFFAYFCLSLLANGCIQGMYQSYLCSMKFVALSTACSAAYVLGFVDFSFTLMALSAITELYDAFIKLLYCWFHQIKSAKISSICIDVLFASSLVVFCSVYFYVIPVDCLNPLASMRLPGNADLIRLGLFISLLCWINLAIYKSPLLNLIFHQLYHLKKSRKEFVEIANLCSATGKQSKESMALVCLGNYIECSLFPPGIDDGLLMEILRVEEKKKRRLVNVRRRPKQKPISIQICKYLLAVKRKIRTKIREALWDESSDDSETDSDAALDCDSDESFISSDDQSRSQTEICRSYSEEDTLPLGDIQKDTCSQLRRRF